MGVRELLIEFKRRTDTFKFRAEKGVVALVLKDTTIGSKGKNLVFNSIRDVVDSDFTEDNYNYIRLAFMGNPNKVMVEVIDDFTSDSKDLTKGLKSLELKRFSYMAIPELPSEKNTEVEAWVSSQRKLGKVIKAVLNGVTASNESSLINFTTDGIKTRDSEKTYTALQYTPRIAGLLAGLPSTQSSTFSVLSEVYECNVSDNENTDIDSGKLILTNDGEKVKIARGVTAMTEVTPGEIEDFKKIKIRDTADMIEADVRETWDDHYVGKVMNTYPNKQLFLNSVKGYLNNLQKEGILDPSKIVEVDIDIEENIKYLKEKGEKDPSEMELQEIKEANTGAHLFAYADIRIADAMEDLKLKFYM